MSQAASAPYAPTLDQFLDDGFCRIDNAIDADELAQLETLYDACFSSDQHRDVTRKSLGGTDDQGRDALPQVLNPTSRFPELAEMRYFKHMREIAAEAFGQPITAEYSHMILKPAGYGVATPWHQDQAYHDPAFIYRKINFWLPLDGATVEGGCMHYVQSSHRGPVLPHEYLVEGDEQSAMVAQDQEYWSLNSTPVPCPRGSVCLHHSYCMHYAGPNTTNLPRRAYILVFGVEPEPRKTPWQFPWQTR
ncbi:MAG: phytanoyl-CoA dioxygenase family protein [Planctomycetota bacterium]